MGEFLLSHSKDKIYEEARQEEEEYEKLFPSDGTTIVESREEEDEEVFFFLWDINSDVWEIYKILRLYLDEKYNMNSGILLELIKAKNADSLYVLASIPFLHNSFVETILPAPAAPSKSN